MSLLTYCLWMEETNRRDVVLLFLRACLYLFASVYSQEYVLKLAIV